MFLKKYKTDVCHITFLRYPLMKKIVFSLRLSCQKFNSFYLNLIAAVDNYEDLNDHGVD